ncbi:MAG: hypothetical protein A3E37_04840 [Candidatus Andersenbacteria bacterium RIFCSPHIGHO2_12_FULL_46_9]|nr:MAG: Methyltransferase type 11 [Parcubacteria group bacterium GW2011_GWA2_45_14]OGY34457.1 MAG: hypothetical protein A3B76_04090 [Candidatus Andersenbacteria bacterium RIFCSPHIGHO2_02_FULL_46_16]OGY36294.1 MAG: hypothetical protein A3E37_04840 [Candidatus Andersenbacteria bacterium RIFCSPHIGHO2_12_FULL_46_9]OGY38193.1 MAG: hypothetical protein A3I08_00960 [Candidatus Andersenbacteria bacterium RIFCSPLOWO2_02_FULL_46_11]OGY41334.1 MAG: hypothetical protein A3G57_02560 [Candidatus Andersenbact
MKNFFDIIAPIYEIIHFGAEKTFRKIESIAYFKSSDNVLDLGGGTGRISRFLANKVEKIVVVDCSQKMIKGCKKHPGLLCVYAQAEELPFPEQSFSKIIVVDAFHHFQNQKQVVKEIKKVLVNNGQVVIEEFNPVKMFGKLIVIIEKMFCLGSHLHSPASLENLFSMNGFKTRIVNENKSTYYLMAEKSTNSL